MIDTMKKLYILFIPVFLLLSCATGSENEDITGGDPEFNITISGGSAPSFNGNQNSTWSPDLGTILLRTNDDVEPVAQLIMEVRESSEFAGRGIIISAILTTSDVQVGTAAEINGKTYYLKEQLTTAGEPTEIRFSPGINDTYAQADYVTFQMERQIINQHDVEELITVSGTFTAKIQ